MEYPNETHNPEKIVEQPIPVHKSKSYDGSHEGIPPGLERERLSELKQIASKHATRSGPPQKGSPAAVAQSALGKYASAIGVNCFFFFKINKTITKY
jgi:hypothetical protein